MNEFVVTAAGSMRAYAARVMEHLARFPAFAGQAGRINAVDLIKIDRFADGEKEAALSASVRGKHVFVFSSSARNEAGLSVDAAKIELYHIVDALKRAQAEKIIIFEPFISCSRSDRTTRRSSVGLWVHFKILTSLGARHIITYQLHSNNSKSMLDPSICTLDDIPALTILERYLCDTYIRDLDTLKGEVAGNWAFCSVDAGGEKLARAFADAFGAPLVVAHKQRDYSKANSIKSISILTAESLRGKTLWIVDDLIDTGGSVESLVRALAPLGPGEVNLIAVHAPLSPPAEERLRALAAEGLLRRMIVSDTVCRPSLAAGPGGEAGAGAGLPALEVVPSAELSARIIRTVMLGTSMSKLLRPFSAEIYLKSPSLFNGGGE